MSKIAEYAEFLTPNPVKDGEYILTIKISIKGEIIEQGAFEAIAMGKGWGGQEPAPQFLIEWAKRDATETLMRISVAQAAAAAGEAKRIELTGKM